MVEGLAATALQEHARVGANEGLWGAGERRGGGDGAGSTAMATVVDGGGGSGGEEERSGVEEDWQQRWDA